MIDVGDIVKIEGLDGKGEIKKYGKANKICLEMVTKVKTLVLSFKDVSDRNEWKNKMENVMNGGDDGKDMMKLDKLDEDDEDEDDDDKKEDNEAMEEEEEEEEDKDDENGNADDNDDADAGDSDGQSPTP